MLYLHTTLPASMATRQKVRRPHTRSIVTVAMSVSVADRIAKAASAAGESTSGFVRAAAVERANAVLGPEPELPAVRSA